MTKSYPETTEEFTAYLVDNSKSAFVRPDALIRSNVLGLITGTVEAHTICNALIPDMNNADSVLAQVKTIIAASKAALEQVRT